MFRVQSLQRPEDKLPGIPESVFLERSGGPLLFATKYKENREPCTSWPLSVCYGAFLCHEVQES